MAATLSTAASYRSRGSVVSVSYKEPVSFGPEAGHQQSRVRWAATAYPSAVLVLVSGTREKVALEHARQKNRWLIPGDYLNADRYC